MNRHATNQRFQSVWQRASHCASGADVGRALIDRYSESARYYHTLQHIDYCLEVFDHVKHYCVNQDAVELAIWFHDVIYDFPVEDNERLSAEYFMEVSRGQMPDELRQVVFDQVMVTDHRTLPEDNDQKILTDIDLSSFGRPWDQFLYDGENVRREMGYLDDGIFYSRQISFMESLLARRDFYATPWFQQRYEITARENLTRYLRSLARQGYAVI